MASGQWLVKVPDSAREIAASGILVVQSTVAFVDNSRMRVLPLTPVRSYRDLIAWQKALALVTQIYRCTQEFPKAELYGLTAQIRRAAVSVPSNIAEGQGRLTTGEFKQFLGHARGSLMEVETQIMIAQNLSLLNPESCHAVLGQCEEVGRILNGLIASLPRQK